jgi:hypothetical protein
MISPETPRYLPARSRTISRPTISGALRQIQKEQDRLAQMKKSGELWQHQGAPTLDRKLPSWPIEMERAEIAELFYNALINLNDLQQLTRSLSAKVEWLLSAADPETAGEESPPNAIRFFGKEDLRQLAVYFRDKLHVFSGDLTGCITHHHLVFVFGRVRLRTHTAGRFAETQVAAKLTYHGSKIIKGQIRISWPLAFEA